MFLLKRCITFIFCIAILCACAWKDGNDVDLLASAEALIEDNPDSALALLDNIAYPKQLNTSSFNKYILLSAQAKEKVFGVIEDDSLLFVAKDYFVDKEDWKNATLATFYCGRMLQSQKQTEAAMQTYLKAEDYSTKADDLYLKGLVHYYIGELNYGQFLEADAISRYRRASQYFKQSGKYKSESLANQRLGSCFLLNGYKDSASYYYREALAIAMVKKDSLLQGGVLQSLGVLYKNGGDLKEARKLYRGALTYYNNSASEGQAYLNIATTFSRDTEKDSVVFYIKKALAVLENADDNILRLRAYNMLSGIEENTGNYKSALDYYHNYTSLLDDEYHKKESMALLDIQKKYDFELIKNENNRLTIEKQTVLLIVLVLLLFILVMSFVAYRSNIKNKEALASAESKIGQLNEVAEGFKEKRNAFREVIFEHFDVLKKAALLAGYLREDEKKQGQKLLKKFNEVVYNQESMDWNMLLKSMNHLYNNFPDKLKKAYPQLDESEFRICSLTYADLNNTEISIIMGLSINTIQAKKSSVRRKLNIEGYGNIVDFLNQKLKM